MSPAAILEQTFQHFRGSVVDISPEIINDGKLAMETKEDIEQIHAALLNKSVNPTGLSHADEYKLLRGEIMQRMRDIHQTEIFGAIGVGLLYSWFILHKTEMRGISSVFWFIGPGLVVLCAISCLVNVFEMRRIGRYLARIEEVAFAGDEKLIGWESEQRHSDKQRWVVHGHFALSLGIWVAAFVGTVLASWALSRS